MSYFLFIIGVALAQTADPILDGESVFGTLGTGENKYYKWHLDQPCVGNDCEAAFFLTTYSDWTQPIVYVSKGKRPTVQDHDYACDTWGNWGILIRKEDITENTDYFLMVTCEENCKFTISLSYMNYIELADGIPQTATFERGWEVLYKFYSADDHGFAVHVTPKMGDVRMYITTDPNSIPNAANSLEVLNSWHHGQRIHIKHKEALRDTWYYIAVIADSDTSYTVVADKARVPVQLQASEPFHSWVGEEHFKYFNVTINDPDIDAKVLVTIYSGDVDIYVKPEEPPTMDDYTFASMFYGNETLIMSSQQRKDYGHPTGNYIIGIRGLTRSTFILTATVNPNSIIPILSDISMQGIVKFEEIDHFALDVPKLFDSNITFQLNSISGDADLYVKPCFTASQFYDCLFTDEELSQPESNGVWSSLNKVALDTVSFEHLSQGCVESDQACRYVIGSVGKATGLSVFTISASYHEESELVLIEGYPLKRLAYWSSPVYLKYNVFEDNVEKVSFTVTPVDGDPDIYVSRTDSKPNKNNAEKHSANYLSDTVTYNVGEDGRSLEGEYHITVTADYGMSYFTIVAIEEFANRNSMIKLLPGHIQDYTLFFDDKKHYQTFSFDLNLETKEQITITIAPKTGKFTMYCTNVASELEDIIEKHKWSSKDEEPNTKIIIRDTDEWNRSTGTYYIRVVADQFEDNIAGFGVSYSIGEASNQLSENVAVNDAVEEQKSNYYFFSLREYNNDLKLSLTAITGDPDIYISINENPHPSKTDNWAMSTNYGSDSITLYKETLQEQCSKVSDTECTIYIAIYAFEASRYTLQVSMSNNLPALITKGNYQYGSIDRTDDVSDSQYYYADIGMDNTIEISVQSTSGDADLFVNLINKQNSGQMSQWQRPHESDFEYKSDSFFSTDKIEIAAEDLADKASEGGNRVIVLIAVFCYTETCRFSLLLDAKNGSVVTLLEGVPFQGAVADNESQQFEFFCGEEETEININVDPYSFGGVGVFVKKGADTNASQSEYDWNGSAYGYNYIVISPDDEYFLKGEKSMKGTYSITIIGEWDTEYIITITTRQDTSIHLYPGMPMSDHVNRNEVKLYNFYNSDHKDLSISVIPSSGSPSVYIKAIRPENDELASQTNFVWTSENLSGKYEIQIPNTDFEYCELCDYSIAVYSGVRPADYTLTISNIDRCSILLQNGVPYIANVGFFESHCYVFKASKGKTVNINLKSISGDADLYVGLDDDVQPETALWKSEKLEEVDHVKIEKDDENYPSDRTFYIDVQALFQSYYSITAVEEGNFIQIVEGWPASLSLQQTEYLRFAVPPTAIGGVVTCQLIPEETIPNIYVNFANKGGKMKKPDSVQSDFTFTAEQFNKQYNEYRFELPAEAEGNYLFTIRPEAANSVDHVTMQCVGEAELTTIVPGQTMLEHIDVPKPGYKLYELFVAKEDDEHSTVQIYAEPCEGRVKLQVLKYLETGDGEEKQEIHINANTLANGMIAANIVDAVDKYYLNVTALDASEISDEVSFQLTTIIHKSNEALEEECYPGDTGHLSWELEDSETVKLKWKEPTHEDGTEITTGKIKYYVYATTKDIPMTTACQMRIAEGEGWGDMIDDTTETELTFSIEEKTRTMVNVVAQVSFGNKKEKRVHRIAYTSTEIYSSHGGSGSHRSRIMLIFGVVFGILALAIGVIVCLYARYRKVQTQLKYEMNDVRNVAGLPPDNAGVAMARLNKPQRYDELED